MKKNCLIIFLLFSILTYSQQDINTPPSPSVASLVTVKKDSVNNTGQVFHNVNLWNMNLRKDTFPINLMYSSSGLKIEEIPSNVGIGWNLSSGGVITRVINDLPDDFESDDHGVGILHTNILSEIEAFKSNVDNNGYNEQTSLNFLKVNVSQSNTETHNDTQPDIFHFNFFDYQGKFVFNKNKEIVSLSNDNFKYSYNLDNDGNLESFTIIDTKSNTYIFSVKERSLTYSNAGVMWESLSSKAKRQRHMDFYSSWHLTTIITSYGEEISFEYDNETVEYQLNDGEMGKICISEQCEDTSFTDYTDYDVINASNRTTTDYIIESKKIKKITSDLFNVTFNNTMREDLNGGLKLSNLTVKDYNNNVIFNYEFIYNYITSPNIPSSNNYEYKRLKLERINLNNQLLQEFDYYNVYPIPHRKSTEQDFWGYYNDNNSSSLVPKIYLTLNGQTPKYHIFPPLNESVVYTFGDIDRNANPQKVHMGMLKSIYYNTGGKKTFFYESNDFTLNGYTNSGSSIKGCGVRLNKIEYFDGQNIETYDYDYVNPSTDNSSGKLSYLPTFAVNIPWTYTYTINNGSYYYIAYPKGSIGMNYYNNPIFDGQGNYIGQADCYSIASNSQAFNYSPTNYPEKYFAMTTRRYSTSQAFSSLSVSTPIVYEFISIKEGNNGKKIFNFNILGALGDGIPSEYDSSNFLPKQSYKTFYWNYNNSETNIFQTSPPCNNLLAPIGQATLNAFNEYSPFVDLTGKTMPFAPTPNWNKFFGVLKKITYENESGYKVYQKTFNYDLKGDFKNSSNNKKIVSLKYKLFDRPTKFGFNITTGVTTSPTAWIWSFYDIHFGADIVPSSTVTTQFFNNELTQISNETHNTYSYGNLLSSSITQNSTEENLETNYRYSINFHSGTGTSNPYNIMTTKNLINTPIEIITKVNGNIVDAEINEYFYDDDKILLKQSFRLEKNTHLYSYDQASANYGSSSFSLIKDDNMIKKFSIDSYDNYGNIIQFTNSDDVPVTYIWGYKKSKLIASIVGQNHTSLNSWFTNHFSQNIEYLSSLSNNDNSEVTENNLIVWLANFRYSAYQGSNNAANILSYTYNPLIGITSITNSRNKTLYYHYDEFNRLNHIKDGEGNILDQNDYNYANQN